MAGIRVRAAQLGDCQEIMRMIKELAKHIKSPEQVKNTTKGLRRDGFEEPSPLFRCLVAEVPMGPREEQGPSLVGYAFTYNSYSTWKGRSLHLEDLYVMPQYRGHGIGTKLLKAVAEMCLTLGCCHLQFSILDWNSPALSLCLSHGAADLSKDEGWHLYRIPPDKLRRMVSAL
ncbi:hypothetical protein GDO86_018080 [Hymenochirus boettgeri]|uniref:N-acetyltransferase domain-containing protein n=1 Tax=Hymenochirus boettgeri TaxID=247094 RepID=A0A8T2IIU4_9PIPI|nr:hypothetical protein GDO86_018080 [Hymenochirus boettgeri]